MPFTSDQPRRQVVSTRRPALLIVVGAVAALLLAACGSDTPSDTGGTSPSPEETSTSTPEAGKATSIEVSETEFAIKLSKSSVPAGDYTFAIANDGQFPHNLAIKGPGIDGQTSETFPGGKSGELTVTLQKGTYTVWCGVGNHRAQGMETKLEVTE